MTGGIFSALIETHIRFFPSGATSLFPPTLRESVVHTGGEGTLTQWVHCGFVVSFEAIHPVITQWVCGEFF